MGQRSDSEAFRQVNGRGRPATAGEETDRWTLSAAQMIAKCINTCLSILDHRLPLSRQFAGAPAYAPLACLLIYPTPNFTNGVSTCRKRPRWECLVVPAYSERNHIRTYTVFVLIGQLPFVLVVPATLRLGQSWRWGYSFPQWVACNSGEGALLLLWQCPLLSPGCLVLLLGYLHYPHTSDPQIL